MLLYSTTFHPEIISEPRTAPAWAALQNEVNELNKEVEFLKEIEKVHWRQIQTNIMLHDYLEEQVDSLIKALRERDRPGYRNSPGEGIDSGFWKLTPLPTMAAPGDSKSPYDLAHPKIINLDEWFSRLPVDSTNRHFIDMGNGCILPVVRHSKHWARKHKNIKP